MNLNKTHYPNCTPSPLRITTHTIKARINSDEEYCKDFKINLITLAEFIDISDEIMYIEYKNKDIVHVKGINPKINSAKKASKKGKFYNCLTLITQPEKGFYNNIKLFRNGSISGTGIKKPENGRISIDIILKVIQNLKESVLDIGETEIPNNKCKIHNYSIALINSDYDISYEIKRLVLHSLLVNQYKIFSSYEPCIYPGVNSKYFWNREYFDNEFKGKCYCKGGCVGNGTGNGEGDCKKITIAIFQSGSLIITGARSLEQIECAYYFINDIFEKHYNELTQEKASFLCLEDTVKKDNKNTIYIKRKDILVRDK
jgi:TATA-box binding protein (TBP) (component of TFIID and TFIIIB)